MIFAGHEVYLDWLCSSQLKEHGLALVLGAAKSGKTNLLNSFMDSWGTPRNQPLNLSQNGIAQVPVCVDLPSFVSKRDYPTPARILQRILEELVEELNARVHGISFECLDFTEMDHSKFSRQLHKIFSQCRFLQVDIVFILERLHRLADPDWLNLQGADDFLCSLKSVWEPVHRKPGLYNNCSISWIMSGDARLMEMADKRRQYNLKGSEWLRGAIEIGLNNLNGSAVQHMLGQVAPDLGSGVLAELAGWIHEHSGGQIKLTREMCDHVRTALGRGVKITDGSCLQQIIDQVSTNNVGLFATWKRGLSESAKHHLDHLLESDSIRIRGSDVAACEAANECAYTGIALYDRNTQLLSRSNRLFWDWFQNVNMVHEEKQKSCGDVSPSHRGNGVESRPVRARTPNHRFKKSGAFWNIIYGGAELPPLPDKAGMKFIAYLLRYHDEIGVLELVNAVEGQSTGGPHSGADISNLGLGTGAATQRYNDKMLKAALKTLESQLAEALAASNLEKQHEFQDKISKIKRYLSSSVDKRGHERSRGQLADYVETERQRVSKNIKTAISTMNEQCPDLGRYLTNAIKPGAVFRFLPERKIDWEF